MSKGEQEKVFKWNIYFMALNSSQEAKLLIVLYAVAGFKFKRHVKRNLSI